MFSPRLILASGLSLTLGMAALAIFPRDTPMSERIQGYFYEENWRVVLLITGGLVVVALLLSIVTWLLERIQSRNNPTFGALSPSDRDSTIANVKERLESYAAAHPPNVSAGLDALLEGGMTLNASDIHFNPLTSSMKVTYRVDGVLCEVASVSREFSGRLTGRIKVLARLDTYSHEPQDGSLRRQIEAIEVEARVSCLPANHGERVVLRLVRGGTHIPDLKGLGFPSSVQVALENILQKPEGIFFVSGPVGSGKTTTLYSALQFLHERRGDTTSLVTLEDPIELQLPFATQTQINSKVGMSFSSTLRAVLRQDPGALMLGEIRDRETAEIATQAGLTGHLILSTIHVQSAAGTFARLIEMGVEPFILASSCAGSLAQRLVRGLCPECREVHTITPAESDRLKSLGHSLENQEFFRAVGCPTCEGRGYVGRYPIAELLVMSDPINAAIIAKRSSEEIHTLAVSEGMISLLSAGLELARAGKTSLAEVLRVAG